MLTIGCNRVAWKCWYSILLSWTNVIYGNWCRRPTLHRKEAQFKCLLSMQLLIMEDTGYLQHQRSIQVFDILTVTTMSADLSMLANQLCSISIQMRMMIFNMNIYESQIHSRTPCWWMHLLDCYFFLSQAFIIIISYSSVLDYRKKVHYAAWRFGWGNLKYILVCSAWKLVLVLEFKFLQALVPENLACSRIGWVKWRDKYSRSYNVQTDQYPRFGLVG